MKPIMLLPILALLLAAGCAPKPAANTTLTDASGINAAADCAGAGPTNSEAYTDCVQSLSNPNAGMNGNAAQMRAQIQQEMAQQRAQMQAQMNSVQAGGGNSAGCVTTRDANNNVSTQCP